MAGAVDGSALVVPLATAVLAHQRLSDVRDMLDRKITSRRVSADFGGSALVRVRPLERRVHALAAAATANMEAGPAAGVAVQAPGSGVGSYALLGSLGYELPAYADVLAPGAGWIADTLRRGTPDVHRSRVQVRSPELALEIGRQVRTWGAQAENAAGRAFVSGMLAGAAAGVVASPLLADLLAVETHRDWTRFASSGGSRAVDFHARRRFLGGVDPSPVGGWLPSPGDVPAVLWQAYFSALDAVYGIPGSRPRGFAAFEHTFQAGASLDAAGLRAGYGRLLDDLRTSSWPLAAWWGLLLPIVLGPSLALLAAHGLPHARFFFEDAGAIVDGAPAAIDERAVFELLTVAMGIGAVAPLVYSMILWSKVDGHKQPFVTALVMGLARAGLVTGGLATAGEAAQTDVERWLFLFAPLAGTDAYALARVILPGRSPGDRSVYALQTIPAMTGAVTLAVAGLLRAIEAYKGWRFWLAWGLFTAAMGSALALPVANALRNGGGWQTWFLGRGRRLAVVESLAAASRQPGEPLAAARAYDTSALWPDTAASAPDLADFAFPSGMRPLVRLWWEGTGDLSVSHDADTVVLRGPAGDTTVRLPVGTTATALAQLLRDALEHVRAEVVGAGDPAVELPWPSTLADPGDELPAAEADAARMRFVAVGRTPETAEVLRHAPRAELSTAAGLTAEGPDAFPVVPAASLGDLEGSGLGGAAELAALLTMAAAPTLASVPVAAVAPPDVAEVAQVFRRWNLDERRLEEWRTLMTGGAVAEAPPAGGPDELVRPPPSGHRGPGLSAAEATAAARLAAAMGWLPLWRAWLKVATDLAADVEAPAAEPYTPLVRFPDGSVRRPTNGQLSLGVRYLLDLEAT